MDGRLDFYNDALRTIFAKPSDEWDDADYRTIAEVMKIRGGREYMKQLRIEVQGE
jgi:hypothetical protein